MRASSLALCIAALATLLPAAAPARAAWAGAPAGRIIFSASRGADGAMDIFSADLAGEAIVNLTDDPAPDRSPSWSPDGTRIVFASRREQNWDLYLMNADGSNLRRLTDSPAYDGEPAWSPDSRQLAFTSWRDGNQEVYRLTLRDLLGQPSAELRNLTDHPAPDHSPAWSPDGRRIAFISDREGSGNLTIVDIFSGAQQQAGPSSRGLQDPSWTPGGGLLAVGTWTVRGQRFSSRQGVLLATPGLPAATFVVGSSHTYAEPEWSSRAAALTAPEGRTQVGRPQPVAAARPDLSTIPTGLADLGDVRSGGLPRLARAVQPSFVALRQAVIAASGHDFLARLSEATRAVSFRNSTSSYTSWHKAGRAFDTLFDYQAGGRQVLYISPEVRSGRLFWRLYLRAARQDGTQGAPLAVPVFNPASREVLPPPSGYFVDFTALAAEHGWSRIAAQERDNFDWRSELLALEYWHFERRDGLSWYQAMSLLYDDRTLETLFGADQFSDRPSIPGNLGLPWGPQSTPPITGGYLFVRGRPS